MVFTKYCDFFQKSTLFVVVATLFLGRHAYAQEQGQQGETLGEEIVREYNSDTSDPNMIKDINNLLDSLKNENQLSPETRALLRKLPPDKLKSSQRTLQPKNNVEIDRAQEKRSVFSRTAEQDKNVNTRGDVAFGVQKKLTEESTAKFLDDAYRALESGQIEAAASLYKRVIYADPDNKQALFGLASVYQRSGQLAQARSTYSKLLTLDPENWPAMNNFLILAAEEAPDHAIEEFVRLMKINPQFAPIPAQIGMIYYQQKKYDNAANYLVRAIQLDAGNLSYRFNLAVIYDKLGRGRQAARLYEQLLEAANQGKTLPENVDKIQERLTYLRSNNAPAKYN